MCTKGQKKFGDLLVVKVPTLKKKSSGIYWWKKVRGSTGGIFPGDLPVVRKPGDLPGTGGNGGSTGGVFNHEVGRQSHPQDLRGSVIALEKPVV